MALPIVTPKVTVITATRNRRALLGEAIDSVQRQEFADWEHLVIDDGSEDGTEEDVGRRAKADPRIRLMRRSDAAQGANICRNIGIRESRGELIVFLDSDDLLDRRCLGQRIDVMARNRDLDFAVFPASLFTGGAETVGRRYAPRVPGDDLLRFLSLECPWDISGPVWRRNFLLRIKGFDDALLSMQDLEMHVRAIACGARYAFFEPVDHYVRAWSDASNTSARHFSDPRYLDALHAVRSKMAASLVAGGMMTWTRQRALAGLCFNEAESWVALGQLRRALQTWSTGSVRYHAPAHIRLVGVLMLCVVRMSGTETSWPARAVNKWKGWARFRPEPELMPPSSPSVATEAAS